MRQTNTNPMTVRASGRLHFGLLAFGAGVAREYDYGGVGVMVSPPQLVLRITESDAWMAKGRHAERVTQFASHWSVYHGQPSLPDCCIEVVDSPPMHRGLGTGTQLALSVAAGLNAWLGREAESPESLAASVNRGKRSAIGTHGFLQGGLLVDRGKRPGDRLGNLAERMALPETWRFVLLSPPDGEGLAGEDEQVAFARLPAVPREVTQTLIEELETRLVPAARGADFDRFGESLYRYGMAAGRCFAPCQGGPFASPLLAQWVAAIRSQGIRGVAQSSWGPTLFALLPSPVAAIQFTQNFCARFGLSPDQLVIAAVDNHGARLECE